MLFRHAALCTLMMMRVASAASSSTPFLKSLRRLEDEESEESEESEEEEEEDEEEDEEESEESEEEEEADYAFLSKYNVLYENCFVGDYSDADNIKEATITYQLCPTDQDCQSGCSGGGKYTANFYYFLDAFTELQLGAREYACEMVRESCEEDETDDDAYWSNCYTNAGEAAGNANMYDYCIEEENEEFNLQEYLECEEFEDEDGNELYIGPYCSDSIQIYIGIFSDEYCTEKVGDPSDYEDYADIQYTESIGKSIVMKDDKENECARCTEHALEQDQNANDAEDEDDTLEQCEELYENAGYKCEDSMENLYYADSSGCDVISQMEEIEWGFQDRSKQTGETKEASAAFVVGVWVVVGLVAVAYFVVPRNQNKDSKKANLIPNRNDLQ